jgi:hypothetical protein
MKVTYLFFLLTITSNVLLCQSSKLLYTDNTISIYESKAFYLDSVIYNADEDLDRLIKNEESDECKVNYNYIYNPLSLIGNYYSFENGEYGSYACGPPSSYFSVQTVDLNTGENVSLIDLFTIESILHALKSDKWVSKIASDTSIYFADNKEFEEFLNHLFYLSHITFPPYGFAVLKYSAEDDKVAVRFVGSEYMGFSHNKHFQLGLWLSPKEDFKQQLINNNKFLLGEYKNGLTK